MIHRSELETVISIVPIPFRKGRVDYDAYARNIDFLIRHNWLDEGRRRAIALGGTSLVHHIDSDELVQLTRVAGEVVGSKAIFISGVLPSPMSSALSIIRRLLELDRPPDFFLLMPVLGVTNTEGLERGLSKLIGEVQKEAGERFLLYMRSSQCISAFSRMLRMTEGLAGIKVGTVAEDVKTLREMAPETKEVLWGVGDRSTEAAKFGSRGHTSGITLICPRLCDEINNAYRSGDFHESYRLEKILSDFEEIRFMEERAYNYSAVVAAAKLGSFDDVDLGDGGPFNAEPPVEVLRELEKTIDALLEYH